MYLFVLGILSDQGLIYIAETFEGNWEPLARDLGLTANDIAKIKSDHPFPDDRKQQIIQLLTVWYLHSKETDEDKVITLFKAIQNHRQYNFINRLMDKHKTGDSKYKTMVTSNQGNKLRNINLEINCYSNKKTKY